MEERTTPEPSPEGSSESISQPLLEVRADPVAVARALAAMEASSKLDLSMQGLNKRMSLVIGMTLMNALFIGGLAVGLFMAAMGG